MKYCYNEVNINLMIVWFHEPSTLTNFTIKVLEEEQRSRTINKTHRLDNYNSNAQLQCWLFKETTSTFYPFDKVTLLGIFKYQGFLYILLYDESCLSSHWEEHWSWISQQIWWWIKFQYSTSFKDHYSEKEMFIDRWMSC